MHLKKMTIKEISTAAAKSEKPPEMNIVELQLYYALATIYKGFRLGLISETEGAAAKKEVVRAFDKYIRDLTILKLLRRSKDPAVIAAVKEAEDSIND